MYCNTILYCDLEEGVRLYCNMRKCFAIGGLKEELYYKSEIVLQDNKGLLEMCCNTIFVLWPTVIVNSNP